nr:hypothetical protein Iba_chr14bCG11930 [Ipomoea batatas]
MFSARFPNLAWKNTRELSDFADSFPRHPRPFLPGIVGPVPVGYLLEMHIGRGDVAVPLANDVAVGDGYCRGALNRVDDPVVALGHGHMVDPNVGGSEDGDAISFIEVGYDDVLNELQRHARTTGDADVRAAPVDGLVARH